MTDVVRHYMHVPIPGILQFDTLDDSTSTNWRCVCPRGFMGAPLYVRVGAAGVIETSDTGEDGTWTQRTSGLNSDLFYVTFNGEKYFAGGGPYLGNIRLLKSDDGITWNPQDLDVAERSIRCIAFDHQNPDIMVALVGPYILYYSINGGDNWTSWDYTFNPGAISGVFHNGACYFVRFDTAANVSDVVKITLSPFSEAVVSNNLWPSVYQQIIKLSSGRLIASGGSGAIAYSDTPDVAASWVQVTISGAGSLRIMEANGRVYAFGEDGEVYVSSNGGATWSAGADSGVSTFLRFGIQDTYTPTRAILVGDSGVTLAGQYGVRVQGYPSEAARAAGAPNALSDPIVYADQPAEDVEVRLIS